jgi:hypothetical protein
LSDLGIYPQLNKYAFMRDVVDIINKDIYMVPFDRQTLIRDTIDR